MQKTKELESEKREPQYIFLDEDDLIDVTGRPDLQEQFLSGVDLYENKAEPLVESGEREFGYLEDMLNDEDDNGRSNNQHQNHTPHHSFQVSACFHRSISFR